MDWMQIDGQNFTLSSPAGDCVSIRGETSDKNSIVCAECYISCNISCINRVNVLWKAAVIRLYRLKMDWNGRNVFHWIFHKKGMVIFPPLLRFFVEVFKYLYDAYQAYWWRAGECKRTGLHLKKTLLFRGPKRKQIIIWLLASPSSPRRS